MIIHRCEDGSNVSYPSLAERQSGPSSHGLGKAIRDSPFKQCEACRNLNFESLRAFHGGQWFRANWAQVKETAVAGCHTCRVLYFAYLGAKKEDSSLVKTLPRPIQLRLIWGVLDAGYCGSRMISCGIGLMPGALHTAACVSIPS